MSLFGTRNAQKEQEITHPALEPGYAMRDMIIAMGTRNMVTNPLSWSSKSAVEPADKNKGFKSTGIATL